VFKLRQEAVKRGYCGHLHCTLFIKDLGPRADRGGAILLSDYGDIETKFVVRAMQGGAG